MIAAGPQQAMGRRQIVAGHTHEQMMLAVIIDPIRRDGRTGDQTRISGPRMGEWVTAAGRGAGMFGNVADTQEQLKSRGQCGQPQQKWHPAPDEQRYRQQYGL